MLSDCRIEHFWMPEYWVVPNISWNMLFNSNLKALGSAPYRCDITVTLEFINLITLLEDREHILMNTAKCSSSCKDGSNPSRVITACNRRRNLIGNQLAWRSNPRKSNINWAYRRAKWPDVIPKLINSFVNSVNKDFLKIPIIKKIIFNLFKFIFNLVIRTNLKSPERETLDSVNLIKCLTFT